MFARFVRPRKCRQLQPRAVSLRLEALETREAPAAGIYISPIAGLNTSETGGYAIFSMRLKQAPTADVTIALASDNTDEGVVGASAVTFTPTNWSALKSIRVTGQADGVKDGNQVYRVITGDAVSADPNYSGMSAPDITLTNRDAPLLLAGVLVRPTDTYSSEDGGTASFKVRLTVKPRSDVSFSITSSNPAEGIPNVGSLIFTPDNWNRDQVVTVTGQPDGVRDSNKPYVIITGNTVSADAKYNDLAVADVKLTNVDSTRLVAGIKVTPTSGLRTDEMGGIANFTIVLTYKPSADVVIPLSSSNPAEGVPHIGSVTFTPDDWNQPKQVMVLGQDDGVFDGDIRYTIITGPAQSADPLYNGMNPADVSVTNYHRTDVRRFDGHYVGSYTGAVSGFGFREPVSGGVVVDIVNGIISVTVTGDGAGDGSGTVSSTGILGFGLANGSVAGATFSGTFSVVPNTSTVVGKGTWRYSQSGVSGSGFWNIQRV